MLGGQAGLQRLVAGVDLEPPLEGGHGVVVPAQPLVGRAEAAVALGPVGLELDGLLGVGEGVGVVVEGGVGGGSVGVEDVVGRGEGDGVGEVADGGAVVAGGEGGVAAGFGFVGHGSDFGGFASVDWGGFGIGEWKGK